ncbi:MAG: polysaccharide biosynthesis protein, partial [Eubacteriales bacterium]|nr:polysaccharide biosynthesis protein [Eubacteriales bacterium]
KMVSEYVSLGDYAGAKRVFRVALLILAGIGLFTGALMFVGSGALAKLSTFTEASLSFKALAPALFFVSVMCAYRGYLQGMQMMTGTAVSQVAEQVFKLIIGLFLAIKLLPKGPEYAAMGALIGVTISELAGLVVIIVYYYAKRDMFEGQIEKQTAFRDIQRGTMANQLVAIALPITIGASISPLSGIVDSALIGRILRGLDFTEEAAKTAFSLLRTNVTTLVNMPSVLTMALAMSLVPAISYAMAQRDYKSVRANVQLGLKLALIIGLPCAVGLFILSKPVLALLYPSLSPVNLEIASELLKTASVGVLFLSLVQSMTGAIQGIGKPSIPVFNLFIGFILKVAVMCALIRIPRINIHGAAVSTVVLYAYAGLADVVYALRVTKLRVRMLDVVLKPVVCTSAMGVAVYFCYELLKTHGRLGTLLPILAGVAVYALLCVLLRVFSETELMQIPGGRRLRRIMYRK